MTIDISKSREAQKVKQFVIRREETINQDGEGTNQEGVLPFMIKLKWQNYEFGRDIETVKSDCKYIDDYPTVRFRAGDGQTNFETFSLAIAIAEIMLGQQNSYNKRLIMQHVTCLDSSGLLKNRNDRRKIDPEAPFLKISPNVHIPHWLISYLRYIPSIKTSEQSLELVQLGDIHRSLKPYRRHLEETNLFKQSLELMPLDPRSFDLTLPKEALPE